MRAPMPTRRTINRSGYTTTPGQPGWHLRTDLPAPSTGRRGAARSIPVATPSASANRLLHGAMTTGTTLATRYAYHDDRPTAGDVNQIITPRQVDGVCSTTPADTSTPYPAPRRSTLPYCQRPHPPSPMPCLPMSGLLTPPWLPTTPNSHRTKSDPSENAIAQLFASPASELPDALW